MQSNRLPKGIMIKTAYFGTVRALTSVIPNMTVCQVYWVPKKTMTAHAMPAIENVTKLRKDLLLSRKWEYMISTATCPFSLRSQVAPKNTIHRRAYSHVCTTHIDGLLKKYLITTP
jgi:hypothetical protein